MGMALHMVMAMHMVMVITLGFPTRCRFGCFWPYSLLF